MKTLQEKKIAKLEEIIEKYKMFYDSIHSPQVITINEDLWNQHLGDLESELAALKSEQSVANNHIEFIRLFKDVIPFKSLNIILEAFNCYCDGNIDRVVYLMGKIKAD